MNLDVPDLDSLGNLSGKRVLVRADYNVPVDKETGAITDDTRIRAGIGTLRKILDRGGRPVVLVHFGRPKGEVVESLRVGVIGERLQELLGSPLITLKESCGAAVEEAVASAPEGSTVLCENVRFHAGETK
ncbi:MAG: phosphoglycerate kinase, partial [Planctomycetota bacterium]